MRTRDVAGQSLTERVVALIEQARQKTVVAVNLAMVYTYYEIGRQIVEEEQCGKNRAGYGERLIKGLAKKLTARFGKGWSVENLTLMRKFYMVYSGSKPAAALSASSRRGAEIVNGVYEIPLPAPRAEDAQAPRFLLSWSHYLKLMRIADSDERAFYEIEAATNNWSLRELQRQFDSSLYERLALSRDKRKVLELSKKGHVVEQPPDALKEPYVLEFLGLKEESVYSEDILEQGLIDHIQEFLLELRKGFAFIGRQVRITDNEHHYRIDLVFYNRLLRCFVLIDLKRGELKHQDIGQMQMYVNYYDRRVRLPDENPTVGILLCHDKSDFVVEYSLPKDNNQIFARQYRTVLPSKAALKRLVKKQLMSNEGD